jgi:uncharacterized protein involved in exopolysaccharide biosynthesis
MKNPDHRFARMPRGVFRFAAGAFLSAAFIVLFSAGAAAQVRPKPTPSPSVAQSQNVRSTPAYAEVLLRKTELTAEVESLLVEYTEEFPRVRDIRTELGFLQKEIDRLLAVPAAETGRLSAALGKLMIRKAEAETDRAKLLVSYKEEHPDVKAAKRRVEMFEAAIAEILGS